MIFSFLRNDHLKPATVALYNSIVAQSRHEDLYTICGVPDTVTGRYDMICLHVALVLHRLRGKGDDAARFSQELTDLFFKDMDGSIREMGVSDLAVPKRMEKMGKAFYGLLGALSPALDAHALDQLANVLGGNILIGDEAVDAGPLSRYCLDEADRLAGLPLQSVLGGKGVFPGSGAHAA